MTQGYDAGTSVGKYVLQADAALKTQLALIKNYQTLAKVAGFKPPAVSTAPLNQQAAALQKAAIAAQRLATEQQKTNVAAGQGAVVAQRLATEQNKTATALVNTARAEQQLSRDTATATAAQDRAATAALRRRQAEERANAPRGGGLGQALPRTFAGFTAAGAGQLAGLAGGAFGAQVLVDAGRNALALRETQNGLRAVSGSTDNYTKTLRIAREQQELFGGTLRENIEGLTGLTITSRQSGAQLETLIDLSQRLAVLDPSQGAAGARIALSEALSGDPTSLAKRYEIPRAALAKLRDETVSASDKLLIIDQYLNRVGISSEAVAGRIDQDALAFRRAAAEIEEATVKLGGYLAKIAAVPARGITELLDTGAVTGGSAAAGENLQGNLIAQAADFEAYAKSVRDANDQIKTAFAGDPIGAALATRRFGLEALNPVQFAYAQSLIQTGIATQPAIDQARALGVVSDSLTQQVQGQSGAFQALIPKMAQVSSLSAENAGQVLALNSAYLQEQISVDQVEIVLNALIRAQQKATEIAELQALETRRLTSDLYNVVPAATAAASAIATAAGAAAGVPENRHIGGIGNLGPGGILGGGAGETFARVDAQQQALQASRDALALARAKTNADRLAIYQRQLDRQTTEEGRNRVLAQIASLKNSGGGATKGLSVLDQDAIQAGATLQAQLDAVNQLLQKQNLTAHQRNDLLEKRRKLEEQIGDEIDRQNRASVDAQLGAVQDAQKRQKETREAAGLQRALDRGRLSGEQRTAVDLRLQEISLEQQKRALDIQKDAKAAGFPVTVEQQAQAVAAGAVPTPGQLPIPNLATLPPVVPSTVTVNLTLNVDKSGAVTATAIDPNITLNLIGGNTTFRNLTGGA